MPKQSWQEWSPIPEKDVTEALKKKAELEGSWKRPNYVNFSLKQLTETHKYFVTISTELIKELT